MDGFLPLLSTTDTKAKLTIAMNLINYLGDPDNTIECSDIGLFIDSLVPWMQSSNNKVCAFSCIFVSSSWFILFDPKYGFTIFFPPLTTCIFVSSSRFVCGCVYL